MTDAVTGLTSAIDILRLGARGDGVGEGPDGLVYVPFALPGERWRVDDSGCFEREAGGVERREPECPHFGRCGGCAMQHVPTPLYSEWKHGLVAEAFAHQGIVTGIEPLFEVPRASRKRAVMTAQVKGKVCTLGFHAAGTNTLIDLDVCVVLQPAIVSSFGDLRRLVLKISSGNDEPFRVTVLASGRGLDVGVDGPAKELSARLRAELAEFTAACRWARLTIGGEVIVERQHPELSFGGVVVSPPAGVFLQAVDAAEHEMQRIVVAGAGRAKTILDLFSGMGTFAFPLAAIGKVLAVDSDPAAITALSEAARQAKGIKPVSGRVRDLHREPMAPKELEGFDYVVFDPPRAGAAAQAGMLARSKVPAIAAVSCNPATLARDLRILLDGGYEIQHVYPVDQFLFSSHVEIVVILRRPKVRKVPGRWRAG